MSYIGIYTFQEARFINQMYYFGYMKSLLIIGLIALLTIARINYDHNQNSIQLPNNYTSTSPILMQFIWGPVQGLGADFTVLKVFSMYYDASQAKDDSAAKWKALSDTLFLAQKLDPQFYDTYHIGVSTLAYDAKLPDKSMQLAYLGAEALPLNWQIPFIGGFIAYDLSHDYTNASKLMSIATHVPNAPTLAVTLAARFLKKDIGTDASIHFLKQMMEILPEEYQASIKARLRKLQKNTTQ